MRARTLVDFSGRSDAELVAIIRGGECEAFAALMQRCSQRLFRVARAVVHDEAEAEDVLQEAYVRAFAALPQLREAAHARTWLTRIVLNEARRRLRRRRRLVELSEIEISQAASDRIIIFPGASADPETSAAILEARRMLERAVDALPESFRLVFILREVEGLSVEETAAELGLQAATVKTRLLRARRRLQRSINAALGSALTDAFPFLGERCERVRRRVLPRLRALQPAG
jgi:RNA polymerase sigma-70 factor (ECF subfamily)